MKDAVNRKFCVAPMMGYTTPYARKLYRILTKESFLFTEMIASKSMIYSKSKDLIIENDGHNPVAIQVGGSELEDLRKCSKIAYRYNYNEINLNVGCLKLMNSYVDAIKLKLLILSLSTMSCLCRRITLELTGVSSTSHIR